jgi:hypothetical protein
MNHEIGRKVWWDHSREILKFWLIDEEEFKSLCGITQTAITRYFGTDDTSECAEYSFYNNNMEFILSVLEGMIYNEDQDENKLHLVTSDMIIDEDSY